MSDGDRDLRKYSRRSAIGLMGLGGGLAATETLGFTNLSGNRGVSIETGGDGNALLELRGKSETDADVDNDPLSDLEGKTVDSEFTIEFINNSDTVLAADDNDIIVTIEGTDETQNVNLNAETDGDFTNNDSDITGNSDIKTFDLDTDVNTGESDSVSITLIEDADSEGSLTIKIDITADFGGVTLDLIRENITIQDPSQE